MKNVPRILPLAGIAIGGVLAINALSGAQALPDLVSGARAFAEDAAKPEKPAKGAKSGKSAKTESAKPAEGVPDAPGAAVGQAQDASALSTLAASAPRPPAICAPTAAELAKEAGLSPAELQVLQSLGTRRGQLDQREQALDTQLALLSAAESKLDAKIRALDGLKTDIKGLLSQADSREQGEIDRLVKVFEGMKAKDAAPRMVALDDSVRIPIAAKMKERSLSAILSMMPPSEAKKLTESLAKRFTSAKTLAANANTLAAAAASATPVTPEAAAAGPAKAKPAAPKRAPAKAPPKAAAKKPAPAAQAAATPAALMEPEAPSPAAKPG